MDCWEIEPSYCLEEENFDSPCCLGTSVPFSGVTGTGFGHDVINESIDFATDWNLPLVLSVIAVAGIIRNAF